MTHCECEHINHFPETGPKLHAYGAEGPVIPTKLRDMGIWKLCIICRVNCHKENIVLEEK